MVVRNASNEREDDSATSVLSSCCGLAKRDTEDVDLAYMQYMKCVPSLDAVIEALGCVHLRWAATDSKEHEHDARRSMNETDCTVVRKCFGAIFCKLHYVLGI